MKSFLLHWKTSAAGLAPIFTGVGMALHALAASPIDYNAVMAGVGLASTGIGLLFAKDWNKPNA